jgi:hypothetical protein
MQMNLNLATKEQIKHAWAFAVDTGRGRRKTFMPNARQQSKLVITSCSRQAKLLGIRVGMHYDEARLLLPDLKVFVYGQQS